jgi:dTDP-4-dehydrorhamnose reductase
MAEIEMRQRCPGLIVCRMPLMYGQPGPGGRNFMGSLAAALREGREVRLFVDEFRSVVCASDAAAGLFLALDKRPALLHLGGRERVSRYEFGALLAACLGADPRLLVPSHQADVSMPAARPPDVSLDSSRAFGLGYDPAPVRESLSRLLAAPAGR